MPLIYEPRGKAREYSPLALNIYSGGCDHACKYCYCPAIMRGAWSTVSRPRILTRLAKEAAKADQQILLSFMGDPYCAPEKWFRHTRAALLILKAAGCSVAILTKGGSRCVADLDIYRAWPQGRIKVGATLTFLNPEKSAHWEPGAASPADRISALEKLHTAGVRTWASIEPVIEPDESLAIIDASLPYVDAYKVGRWNHSAQANQIDWTWFARSAVEKIRAARKALYVKRDLQPYLPPGYLTPEECDQDALALPGSAPRLGTASRSGCRL